MIIVQITFKRAYHTHTVSFPFPHPCVCQCNLISLHIQEIAQFKDIVNAHFVTQYTYREAYLSALLNAKKNNMVSSQMTSQNIIILYGSIVICVFKSFCWMVKLFWKLDSCKYVFTYTYLYTRCVMYKKLYMVVKHEHCPRRNLWFWHPLKENSPVKRCTIWEIKFPWSETIGIWIIYG